MMMIRAAMRDLQARRRRFVVAVAGSGMVLGLGLVMSGMVASFSNEAHRTVALADADAWLVDAGAAGPFTATNLIGDDAVATVRADPGVRDAAPVLVARQTVVAGAGPVFTVVFGVEPGGLGAPQVSRGSALRGPGEVVVDRRLEAPVGTAVRIGGESFTVVGQVRATLFAATPTLYVGLDDARRLSLGGQALSSAVLVRGEPGAVPDGLKRMTEAEVFDDAMEPLASAIGSIGLMRSLLWLVAALLVGSILYLNALERTRDLAVFKAVGTSARSIAVGVVAQAVVVSLAAAAVAAVVASVLAPRFPMPAEVSVGAYLSLPVVALAVGLLGVIGGLRRVSRVPATLAFGAP